MSSLSAVIPAKAGIQKHLKKLLWTPAFAGVTAGAILFFPVHAHAEALAENQARFGAITGKVQVLAQGASQWVDAQIGLPLDVGDEIRIDEDSEVELAMAENVLWIVEGNSDLIIKHTTPQEGHLTLVRGALLGKVGPAANGQEGTWEFETPLGVCAVRGTEFAITYSDTEGTHLGVFKGVVEMRQAETATETYPGILVHEKEEGILAKNTPFTLRNFYSPLMQAQARHLPRLKKRHQAVTGVWSPYTISYRQELRRKYIAQAKPHPAPRRPAAPSRRRKQLSP